MAPALPISLSPHICILSSPDLQQLLTTSSLPPLAHILQSFSPLPQVTTRTTSLTSVPHSSFGLRFSNLTEIEAACREDEEQRADRTLDWIGARISNRCARWLQDIEKLGDKDVPRTPWWDELKRCAEGDHVPNKTEGWNHPVAIILAVSTTAPNPLQAITALHSRAIELPSWVDPTFLRYTLIVHPQNSSFSQEEAGALFNAVKKQYGLHSFLLQLALPSPPPAPVPVPALIPRLPSPPSDDSPEQSPVVPPTPALASGSSINTLRMSEGDIQQTAKFTREFLVMSLVPWMEKCVLEWNENFSSNRRLPSRLFSSTRRLFGSPSPSPSPSPTPTHAPSASLSRVATLNGVSLPPGLAPPSQQRRLAEFATILGDFKLAVTVWESLRKDSKGGSEVLPLLLSPSPAIPLHVANSLSALNPPSSKLTAQAQFRALSYAVRWEIGIGSQDFLSSMLEGERWLVWAAGSAEEPPSALLLAHAALLSARKSARRRAALWYLFAANRLEKCGIKPLTMYFLRKAHELYKMKPSKGLSPSFWDSEGLSLSGASTFDAIASGIEHPLGRLLYTTGDVAGAVELFLGLLQGGSLLHPITADTRGTDKVFMDDFRVAFAHFKSTAADQTRSLDLKLPFEFCVKKQTRVRLARDTHTDSGEWEEREETWTQFWKALVKSGKATVNETFYVDLLLRNPLDTEVNLSKLTVLVDQASPPSVEVEVVDDITLGPGESLTISIAVKSSRPTTLTVTDIAYEFISLLPCTERLAVRGKRLHDTLSQRLNATYGPDVLLKVDVVEETHKLLVHFVEDQLLLLAEGEVKLMQLELENRGTKDVSEVWMVTHPEDHIWLSSEDVGSSTSGTQVEHSDNSLVLPVPYRIALTSALNPGDSVEVSLLVHASRVGEQQLSLLFVYREVVDLTETDSFHSVQVGQSYDVQRLMDVTVSTAPSYSEDHLFLVDVEVENISGLQSFQLDQIVTVSPAWTCEVIAEPNLTRLTGSNNSGTLSPLQSSRLFLGASSWTGAKGVTETFAYVSRKLKQVLHGLDVDLSGPPELDVLHTYHAKGRPKCCSHAAIQHFIRCGRRNTVLHDLATKHPHIPPRSYASTFPLHNPNSVDVVVSWTISSQERHGHLYVSGVTLGASHAALKEMIDEAEGAKVKRSMYAETQRQRQELVESLRHSEWNTEMNPIVLTREEKPLSHQFSNGPCQLAIPLRLRNYSATLISRYVLRLGSELPSAPDVLPPSYTGRVTYRGSLGPLECVEITPRIWVACPGTYALSGWRLETEVLDAEESVRHRYEEELFLGSIIVSDVE
ncbi:ER-golgi trafficking TRAPP I complex 85 kDa subunit-domain-containing protein [Mycena amicta]|nr:ER-golgi trafficking TRAPP I complex 85 kDa subunit-domain-containing protein [Mycena amicta]